MPNPGVQIAADVVHVACDWLERYWKQSDEEKKNEEAQKQAIISALNAGDADAVTLAIGGKLLDA